MVRSLAVKNLRLRIALATVVLGISLAGGRPAGQTPADARATSIATLLDRAATTAPGTYAVTATSVLPEAAARPIVVQADVMRGPEQTIRAAIVIGGVMSQPYAARVRVLPASASAGGQKAVAGDASATGQPGTVRLVREFTLAPGEYEVHAAVGHARSGGGAIVTLKKFYLTVPDIWRGPLAATPVVLGEAVVPVARAPGTRSFEFEPTALTPAASERFAQAGSMHFAFRIYNWEAGADARPDLAAEYVFYQRGAKGQRFFNKMKPQRLDAATLGPAFDPADGAVTAGMTVPLASFPFGEFDLVVRVTDQRNKRSTERRVGFEVAP